MHLTGDTMFCRTHGQELCHRCFCDHRMTNNVRLGVADFENIHEEIDIEERTPLSVHPSTYKVLPDRETLCCTKHSTVGCPRCFNFAKIIREQLQAAGAELDNPASQKTRRGSDVTQEPRPTVAEFVAAQKIWQQQTEAEMVQARNRADEIAEQLLQTDLAEKEALVKAKEKKAAKKKQRKAKKAAAGLSNDAQPDSLEPPYHTLGGLIIQ